MPIFADVHQPHHIVKNVIFFLTKTLRFWTAFFYPSLSVNNVDLRDASASENIPLTEIEISKYRGHALD